MKRMTKRQQLPKAPMLANTYVRTWTQLYAEPSPCLVHICRYWCNAQVQLPTGITLILEVLTSRTAHNVMITFHNINMAINRPYYCECTIYIYIYIRIYIEACRLCLLLQYTVKHSQVCGETQRSGNWCSSHQLNCQYNHGMLSYEFESVMNSEVLINYTEWHKQTNTLRVWLWISLQPTPKAVCRPSKYEYH